MKGKHKELWEERNCLRNSLWHQPGSLWRAEPHPRHSRMSHVNYSLLIQNDLQILLGHMDVEKMKCYEICGS